MEQVIQRKRKVYVGGKANAVADLCGYRGVLKSSDLNNNHLSKLLNKALNQSYIENMATSKSKLVQSDKDSNVSKDDYKLRSSEWTND